MDFCLVCCCCCSEFGHREGKLEKITNDFWQSWTTTTTKKSPIHSLIGKSFISPAHTVKRSPYKIYRKHSFHCSLEEWKTSIFVRIVCFQFERWLSKDGVCVCVCARIVYQFVRICSFRSSCDCYFIPNDRLQSALWCCASNHHALQTSLVDEPCEREEMENTNRSNCIKCKLIIIHPNLNGFTFNQAVITVELAWAYDEIENIDHHHRRRRHRCRRTWVRWGRQGSERSKKNDYTIIMWCHDFADAFHWPPAPLAIISKNMLISFQSFSLPHWADFSSTHLW